jgi:DTW domain-containing protein
VVLIVHAKEIKRTTNSGKLALEALPNSQMIIRGLKDENTDLSHILTDEYESVLFYPAEGATELNESYIQSRKNKKPLQLIVPDGNWRQAAKVNTRYKEFAGLTRVMISSENTAKHHLRQESSSYGMSTLEAIARALKVIEGEAVGNQMLELYQNKLKQTLKGRGVHYSEV